MNQANCPPKFKDYPVSREQNSAVPVLPAAALDALKGHVEWEETSPLHYPVLNKEVPLSKLPPTFFQVDGMDPLRDDALIYDEMLKEAGVKTRINLYPGCPHG